MGIVELAEQWWPVIAAGSPSVWLAYRQWRQEQRADRRDRGDLIKIAQDAAASVIEALRKRLDEVEVELAELRKEHSKMLIDKDAKIALLEGALHMAEAERDALLRILDRHGIPRPVQGQPYWEVTADGLQPKAPRNPGSKQ